MNSKRNYPLLLVSQFLGAFGDNVILMVIVGQLTFLQIDGKISESYLRTASAIYTSLLFVPYVLLAPLAGFLNDRYAKTRWLLGGNAFKLLGTTVCALSIWYGPYWQGIGYFIVGIGSCLYSPAKYGILPEILPRERLVKANGTVELLTLVAILTGSIAGASMIDKLSVVNCYIILGVIFGVSLLLNVFMTRTPANPDTRFKGSTSEFFSNFGDLLRSTRLSRVLFGTGLFWVCGSVMKMNFQPWGINVLGLKTNTDIALLGLWLAIGIMIGSVMAGQMYRVGELFATRKNGWILAVFIALIGGVELVTRTGFGYTRGLVVVLLVLAGIAAGLFLIPLNAALQAESHQGKLGKTIATQNFVDNLGMIFGGAFVLLSIKLGLSASGVFFGLAVLVALVVALLKIPVLKNDSTTH